MPRGFASVTSLSASAAASANRCSENMNGYISTQNASSSNHSRFVRSVMGADFSPAFSSISMKTNSKAFGLRTSCSTPAGRK